MPCEYLRTINKLRPAETFGPAEENYASAVKPCLLAYFPRQVGVNLAWRYNWWEVSQILGIQWDLSKVRRSGWWNFLISLLTMKLFFDGRVLCEQPPIPASCPTFRSN